MNSTGAKYVPSWNIVNVSDKNHQKKSNKKKKNKKQSTKTLVEKHHFSLDCDVFFSHASVCIIHRFLSDF